MKTRFVACVFILSSFAVSGCASDITASPEGADTLEQRLQDFDLIVEPTFTGWWKGPIRATDDIGESYTYRWTNSETVRPASPSCATWTFWIPESDEYYVHARIPAHDAFSHKATYRLSDGSLVDEVNQEAFHGGDYAQLGLHYFGTGLNTIKLCDYTGEDRRRRLGASNLLISTSIHSRGACPGC
jgi:hypothetical protein